jgi:MFS family permease
MHSGVTGSLVIGAACGAGTRPLPFAPTPTYLPERPRAGRAIGVSAMAVAAGTVLGGCATPAHEAAGWRMEPLYRATTSSAPVLSQGYTALARQYEGETRWNHAADAWRKAVAAEPDNADLHTALGVALTVRNP